MKTLLLVVMLFCSCITSAQTAAIIGIVIDADTKAGMSGCNVFISNSSKGKMTDSAGHFSLSGLPEGKSFELIVSNVGYETFTYTFSSTQLPLNLKISLFKKIVQLENVLIAPEEINGWEKWGALFVRSFLGQSENAAECNIENIGIIKFRYFKEQELLEASADGMLIITNERLGYQVKYQLEKFTYDIKKQQLIYLGYPFFQELETVKDSPEKFARRRLKAYRGSVMHFMRSLYADKLKEEGFEVKRMEKIIRFDTIPAKSHNPCNCYDSSGKKKTLPAYYVKKTINEKVDTIKLNSYDLLYKGADSVRDIFAFDNYLTVRYLKDGESFDYAKFIYHHTIKKYQLSTISIVNDEKSIVLQQSGYYYPALGLQQEGYMAWEKMGDLLPLDYEVPQLNEKSGD